MEELDYTLSDLWRSTCIIIYKLINKENYSIISIQYYLGLFPLRNPIIITEILQDRNGSLTNFNLKVEYIYIYIYTYICRKTDNNNPSGRNDLLADQHYSVSVLLNHHQDHEG